MTDSNQKTPLEQTIVRNLRAELLKCAESADSQVALTAGNMIDLLTLAQDMNSDPASSSRAAEIVDYCSQQLPGLAGEASENLSAIQDSLMERWGDYLELLDPQDRFRSEPSNCDWDHLTEAFQQPTQLESQVVDGDEEARTEAFEPSDISRMLSALGSAAGNDTSKSPPSQSGFTSADAQRITEIPLPAIDTDTLDDPEMIAAYSDDGQQCLAEMEASLLQLDAGATGSDPLRQFCRQLHTLKGASGTVGLSQLAHYLHEMENYVESTVATGSKVDVDRLLACVDVVRSQLTALSPASNDNSHFAASLPVSQSSPALGAPSQTTPSHPSVQTEGDQYVRIEASRLDRLMDLLAELVMLRNRRDTYVKSLRTLHDELNYCSARTRSLTMNVATDAPAPASCSNSSISVIEDDFDARPVNESANTRVFARSLIELSNDVTELGRSLDEVCEPLSVDNAAVSHLIGRFRQELMELRRLPISGLFQRLQRTVRDAARAEQKQVELLFVGQGARAERAMQERLFEPLMHLVRNGVSHGIESPQERLALGKSAQGHITLEAWSDATNLFIEVKDDGRGLNDEALEARGRELGLIPLGQPVSRDRLWKLIFQAGFSTRKQVGEISGRGVGMDVVDSWIRRLRGRIDVASVQGQGTTFRLQIPLRSAIEHAMVVRVGGQLFALPMQAIQGTAAPDLQDDEHAEDESDQKTLPPRDSLPLGELLGIRDSRTDRPRHLTLKSSARGGFMITVDAVVGVEEVVVRSLPPLLQRHDLFAGVTLSGRAETVLLIDVPQLVEFASRKLSGAAKPQKVSESAQPENSPDDMRRILIADDSVTVRRSLSRRLKYQGYSSVEASNGVDALRLLRSGGITAVITDIDMPRMNGLELLLEMQSQSSLRQIPVLVVTSRDDRSTLAQISQLGAFQVLTKPVTESTICEAIERLLQLKPSH